MPTRTTPRNALRLGLQVRRLTWIRQRRRQRLGGFSTFDLVLCLSALLSSTAFRRRFDPTVVFAIPRFAACCASREQKSWIGAHSLAVFKGTVRLPESSMPVADKSVRWLGNRGSDTQRHASMVLRPCGAKRRSRASHLASCSQISTAARAGSLCGLATVRTSSRARNKEGESLVVT